MMAYELPSEPNSEIAAFAELWARDAVKIGTEFNTDLVTRYEAMYRNFWRIGRPEATTEKINAALLRGDGIVLRILADAGMYVMALSQLVPGFPARLLSPPRSYTIKAVTFADGHQVASIATFIELLGLVQSHGWWSEGYLEVGELSPEWI
jgi:hypothetical protein